VIYINFMRKLKFMYGLK